jgi:hypothetical protein
LPRNTNVRYVLFESFEDVGLQGFHRKKWEGENPYLELRGGYKFQIPIWSYKAELQMGAALLGHFGGFFFC